MRTPILALRNRRATRGQHPGLLLQRYLCENATGEGGNPEEKRDILQAAISASSNPEVRELYKIAFGRWQTSLPELTAANDLQTVGRLIVGLGTENVLETGIRLHHTYGMPILPGSALKGLAAHYCDQTWGASEENFKRGRPYHQLLFGTTDESGCIIFHDGWFVPDSESEPLKLDVMTPHHPRWLDGSVPPTDFDSPTPVPFLSVAGQFHVAVSWHGPAGDKSRNWTELSLSLVVDALHNWGVGGKTTSGYGRLAVPPPPPPPPPPRKRNSGDRAKVTIIATRTKGGFDVQDTEPGRKPGTLTVGSPPAGTNTSIGAVVDVLVHVDDDRRPQYKWPLPAKK
jgi:CRISPR-associated protein Cmr6